jgi:acetyltransferase-like isoleucine patch superfamily enzyme
MWRKITKAYVNPILARASTRLEWARHEMSRRGGWTAVVDSSAVLHPTSVIDNLRGNPQAIVVGAHTHIRGQLLTFWNGGEISIGEWCYIGEGTRIWSQASVKIGNYVLIAHAVDIHDTNSHPIDWRERRLDTEAILSGRGYRTPTQTVSAPVVIEDDAWIGFKASILKGVLVGRGAIVAAGAVVTKDVEPWSVVAGNPAQSIAVLEPNDEAALS